MNSFKGVHNILIRPLMSFWLLTCFAMTIVAGHSSNEVIEKVKGTWRDTKSYRVNSITTTDAMGVRTVVRSTIYSKGDHLRIESITSTNKSANSEQLTVSDGKITWTHVKSSNRVFKLDNQKLPEKFRNSAQDSVGIEIMKDVEFSVTEKQANGNTFLVLESKDVVKLGSNTAGRLEYWVNPDSWTVSRMYLRGKQKVEKNEAEFNMVTILENYKFNLKLKDRLFRFLMPKNAPVTDVTQDTIRQLG